MKYFYTYVLESDIDHEIYIGYTEDLKKRFVEHNKGLVHSTKNRRPLELIYYEACVDKESAVSREKQLKTGFGRAYLNRRLKR